MRTTRTRGASKHCKGKLIIQEESGIQCEQSDLVSRGRITIARPTAEGACVYIVMELYTLTRWTRDPIEWVHQTVFFG